MPTRASRTRRRPRRLSPACARGPRGCSSISVAGPARSWRRLAIWAGRRWAWSSMRAWCRARPRAPGVSSSTGSRNCAEYSGGSGGVIHLGDVVEHLTALLDILRALRRPCCGRGVAGRGPWRRALACSRPSCAALAGFARRDRWRCRRITSCRRRWRVNESSRESGARGPRVTPSRRWLGRLRGSSRPTSCDGRAAWGSSRCARCRRRCRPSPRLAGGTGTSTSARGF